MEGRPRRRAGLATRLISALGQGVTALVGVLLLAAAGGILLATQTAAGRAAAADFLEDAVAGAVDGTVEVGRVTGGNLFTRIELESFRIRGPGGEPFLELRDVRVQYSPVGLLTGRYHLRRLRTSRLDVRLLQGDDGGWNYERIFGDGDEEEAGEGMELLATDVVVGDGRVEVRTPWASDLSGAARDSAEAAALAGEEVWNLRRVDGRVERVVVLEEMEGRLPLVRLVDPREPMRLEMEGVRGRVLAVRQPVNLRRLDAAATFSDTVRVALDDVRTAAGTRLSGEGRVGPGDPPHYRFDLEARHLEFADLAWLPVPVPADGGGSAERLVVRSSDPDPEETAVEVAGGDFRTGASRVTGDLGLRLADVPRLEGVDLRLRPLRLGLVNRLLDREGYPDGAVEGRVRGEGPLDLFRVDADVALRPAGGWGGGASGAAGPGDGAPPDAEPPSGGPAAVEPSRLRAVGGVGLAEEPRRFRDLRLEFGSFDPRWTRLLGMETRQRGRVDGTATLDRTPGGRVAFTADLVHRAPGDTTSRVSGRGDVDPDGGTVDVSLTAEPLSLTVLDPFFPAVEMVGVVRGPLSVSGTLADLEARADLETPRGRIQFDGRFDLSAERKRYDARLTARDIQLTQWIRGAPPSELDVRGRVEGAGTDPASLRASFDLQVLPSRLQGARVDSSLLRFTVEEGLARVDTFAIRSDVGTLRGRGGFGLASDRSAALLLNLTAPDLSRWNRWLVPGRGPVQRDTTAGDLFAAFPQAGEEAGEGEAVAPPDTLSGQLEAQGAVFGNVGDFGVGGTLTARGLGWGPARADTLRLVMDATDAQSLDSLAVTGGVTGFAYDGQRVDTVAFRVQRTGARSGDVELEARRPGGALSSAASVEWTEERKAVRLERLSVEMGDQRYRMSDAARVVYGDDGLVVDGLLLQGDPGGLLRVDGTVPRKGEADLAVAVEGVDLADLRRLLGLEPEVSGRARGSLRVRGTADAPRMEASVRVDSPGVAPHSYRGLAVDLAYDDRRLDVSAELRGEAGPLARVEGGVRADLSFREVDRRLLDDPLDLRVEADSVPMALLLAPLGSVRDVRGHGVVDARVTGSPEAPTLDGSAAVRSTAMRVPALGVGFREVEGTMTLRGSRIRVDSLRLASDDGGTGEVSGSLDIESPEDPGFDLDVRAHDLRIVDRRKATMLADGEGHLGGTFRRPTLTGTFRLSDGSVRAEDFMRQDEIVDLTDPELYSLVDTTALAERRLLARVRNPFVQNLRAELGLRIGPDLWLRSQRLDVELAGDVDLRMDRAESDVTVSGSVRLVRGSYQWTAAGGFLGRQLRITGGRIEFVGTPGMNPNLDITATHRVRAELGTIVVRANITGTLAEPQLAITSEPPMSESDRLCVLLINSPCSAAGATGQLVSDQLLGRVGTELTSLLSGGGGPDYLTVQAATGARGEQQAGLGNGDAGEGGSLLAGKAVEAGWYLSPELFLTLTQPLGRRTPAFTLDWRFSEAWTVEFRSEHLFGREISGATGSSLDEQRLWGLFLFREWSF